MRLATLTLLCAVLLAACGSSHTVTRTVTRPTPVAAPTATSSCAAAHVMGACVAQHETAFPLGPRATLVNGPQGVDVSRYQGFPEWDISHEHGLRFVYNQASFGAAREPLFATNTIRERAEHLAHGGYVYVYPRCTAASTVAAVLVAAIREAGGFDSLPPAIDQENSGCAPFDSAIASWDCELAQDIRHDDGWGSVVLYTSPGLWPGGTSCGDYLWLADWGGFRLPSSWSSAVAQQFCGVFCTFPGIGGFVDRDVSFTLLGLERHAHHETPSQRRARLGRELAAHERLLVQLRAQIVHLRIKLGTHGCARRRHRHEFLDSQCRGWFGAGDRVHAHGRVEDRLIAKLKQELA